MASGGASFWLPQGDIAARYSMLRSSKLVQGGDRAGQTVGLAAGIARPRNCFENPMCRPGTRTLTALVLYRPSMSTTTTNHHPTVTVSSHQTIYRLLLRFHYHSQFTNHAIPSDLDAISRNFDPITTPARSTGIDPRYKAHTTTTRFERLNTPHQTTLQISSPQTPHAERNRLDCPTPEPM